jgi:hypothetical protein
VKPPARLLKVLALIALGTVMAFAWAPGHRPLVIAAGVMAALACALLQMGQVAQSLAGEGRAWDRVRTTPVASERRPSDLEQLERVLGWGQYSPGDFNYEVRPLLRRLVAHRLNESLGVDIETRPEAARPIVSNELWELIVAKQPVEAGRVIRTEDIARFVDEIEDI